MGVVLVCKKLLDHDDGMDVYIGPISSYMPRKLVIDDFLDSSSDSLIIVHVNCNYLLPHIDEMRIRLG
jgi:hypothetical protein